MLLLLLLLLLYQCEKDEDKRWKDDEVKKVKQWKGKDAENWSEVEGKRQ